MKLTCDSCGTVQSETRTVCELCGDSLLEEAERKREGSTAGILFGAVGATLLLCLAPAVVLRMFWFHEISTPNFAGGYILVWLVGSLVGRKFQPKESYDFGYAPRGYGFIDNPFTLRDNYDRHHAGLGLILLPMNLVTGLWVALFHRLTAR